ncbi:uncharacterized protein N7482_007263 [Penicillium canariense]|uniref:Uncharacterized protein n=1 Tax=Penicillium canariense TaxID=189055 RepID=A0A9W9HWG5_9EURO|nr:uncharacterized protein N7482_007263 [Penicillium canariense]KAJ5160259.1 hypothetical protein N7482_007263 [Penicillium canariense]
MHPSYVSLAIFAMGAAAAAPSFPKADSDPFEGSFPFMPSGSSSVEGDDGLSDPVPAYMDAMQAVQAAEAGAYSPAPTHQVVAKPFHPKKLTAQPVAEPAQQAPQQAEQPVQAQPIAPKPAAPKPVAPMPDADDDGDLDLPMGQSGVPDLDNPSLEIPEAAISSSASSAVAHVKPIATVPAVHESSSSMSIMVSVATPSSAHVVPLASSSMTSVVSKAAPSSASTPVEMAPVSIKPMPVHSVMQTTMAKPSSFSTRPILKASTPTTQSISSSTAAVPKSKVHAVNIHAQHLASESASSSTAEATPSESATPTPSSKAEDPDVASAMSQIPVLGPLFASLTGML